MTINHISNKIFFWILLILMTISCREKSKIQDAVERIPVQTELVRFDQIFYQSTPNNFAEVRKQFPYFFPTQMPDSLFISKLQIPIYKELFNEVQVQFPNFNDKQTEIENLIQHIKYYFPNQNTPKKIITLISEMDYESKSIYTDSLVLVSLDLYLGANHKYYADEFPKYLADTFTPDQILPDIAKDFASANVPQPVDKTLLAQMIYQGKKMYLMEHLLPTYAEHQLMGYSKEKYQWCLDNELEMWRFFVDQNMLYSVDAKNNARFIDLAPFSKFYLDIDQESPGRVGVWMGWQIIRSFMKNNEVSLQDLLTLEAKYIFENSKYKPKKS